MPKSNRGVHLHGSELGSELTSLAGSKLGSELTFFAGSELGLASYRPTTLDRTDFASWQQWIRLYCRGKENGVNILKSINKGPFQMGTLRETLTEGTLHLGPERPRVYSDLTSIEKDRYNADIRATNILLQRLPKDIYSLINHYIDAKDIWDNVKMLLEGSELTKEDRESQLYNDFERFQQHKGETIHDYYVRFAKLINDMRNIKMTMSRMQLNSKFVNNMLPERGRFVTVVKLNRGLRDSNYDQLSHRKELHSTQATIELRVLQRQDVANASSGEWDEQPIQDLALNVDNVFQADDCDAFDYDVDEAPTAQTMFMANLSSVDPVYDEVSPSYDSDVLSEVHDHDHYQDAICEHHEVHEMHDDVQPNYVVDSHTGYTSDSNMILYDQYVKDNAVKVIQSDVYVVPNDAYMMILNDMHERPAQHVYVTTQTKVVDTSLTAELATYKEQVELYERRARFELTEREQKIDEQLRIVITDRNIKEEILKKELHSVKMQLASTINHNKSMVEEVMSLKKDFK
uniref:Putative zinc finger, CCHC-type n=1 Tax=Tanacetum cinerariifolium TaxID=118510 RepID=A0A6L2JHS7_TANCI|nr:putative zinc finger, CCHC-type [Tanacetum cinerariifolium]